MLQRQVVLLDENVEYPLMKTGLVITARYSYYVDANSGMAANDWGRDA